VLLHAGQQIRIYRVTLRERVGITLLLQQGRPTPVEEELLHAPIVSIRGAQESTENAGTSRVSKVALRTRRVCFHKTAVGINRAQASLYGHKQFGVLINESAAWMLAKALGAPFDEWVPPTVIRSIWPTDQKLAGGYGVLSIGMEGQTNVDPPLEDPAYCDSAAFWDALIGQQDRHCGNYRFDTRAHEPPLGLIDNGYAFAAPTEWNTYASNASVFVRHRRQGGRLALSAHELAWLDSIAVDSHLLSDLGDILEPVQFDAFLARIRRMTSPPREILDELEF